MKYWKPNENMIRKKKLNITGSAQQRGSQVGITHESYVVGLLQWRESKRKDRELIPMLVPRDPCSVQVATLLHGRAWVSLWAKETQTTPIWWCSWISFCVLYFSFFSPLLFAVGYSQHPEAQWVPLNFRAHLLAARVLTSFTSAVWCR
jgi:hypothetical protein